MFIFFYETRVISRLLRHLLITIFTDRASHNEKRMTRKLIHSRTKCITMIIHQMTVDF